LRKNPFSKKKTLRIFCSASAQEFFFSNKAKNKPNMDFGNHPDDPPVENASGFEYDDFAKTTQKKKLLSMFHHEQWRSQLSEKLSELSIKHKDERQRMFPKNIFLMNEDERNAIIDKVNEQLLNVGETIGNWLNEKHEQHTAQTGEMLDCGYSLRPFSICYGNEESKSKRQKMVVILASPTLSQIESQHIDPNPQYPNGIWKIQTGLEKYPDKAFSFVFSIPFFLGVDLVKQDIVSTPGYFRALLIYTRDLMRALNPSAMMAVSALAFERTLNRFEEKNAKETIRHGGSLFYSHMNDAAQGECKVALIQDNPICCYYLPHPFTISTKDAKASNKENWDATWVLIDKLWGAKHSAFKTSFVNAETKLENKDASEFIKHEAALFYEIKKKKKKDPVRKLPKGKRISVGMDSFVTKKTIVKLDDKK
jgi:hypothetical protein